MVDQLSHRSEQGEGELRLRSDEVGTAFQDGLVMLEDALDQVQQLLERGDAAHGRCWPFDVQIGAHYCQI